MLMFGFEMKIAQILGFAALAIRKECKSEKNYYFMFIFVNLFNDRM